MHLILALGGGLTHLREFLNVAQPNRYGISKIYLWGNEKLLSNIESRIWLFKVSNPLLNKGLTYRLYWHVFKSKSEFKKNKCDIVLTPGGTSLSGFKPNVTMCRNMLPFEWVELARYGVSKKTIKLIFLRFFQIYSFKRANGVIYLSEYARDILKNKFRSNAKDIIIPHGINKKFLHKPKETKNVSLPKNKSTRIVYVSNISPYKHQWNVVKAVSRIRLKGYDLKMDLIGNPEEAMPILEKSLLKYDPKREFIFFKGPLKHELLAKLLLKSDIGIFASSCENLPNILLEKMATGLSIACSCKGPMPEILGDAGEYFDPLYPEQIETALEKLLSSNTLSSQYSNKAFTRATLFTWEKCANETLKFLSDILDK